MGIKFMEEKKCIDCSITKPVIQFRKTVNEGVYTDLCKQCIDNNRIKKHRKYNKKKYHSVVDIDGSWMGSGDGWSHL